MYIDIKIWNVGYCELRTSSKKVVSLFYEWKTLVSIKRGMKKKREGFDKNISNQFLMERVDI